MGVRVSITARGKTKLDGVRITSKGQVTIPKKIRDRHGLMPETEIEIVEIAGDIVLRRAGAQKKDRAQLFVESLEGAGSGTMTTDEIIRMMRGHTD